MHVFRTCNYGAYCKPYIVPTCPWLYAAQQFRLYSLLINLRSSQCVYISEHFRGDVLLAMVMYYRLPARAKALPCNLICIVFPLAYTGISDHFRFASLSPCLCCSPIAMIRSGVKGVNLDFDIAKMQRYLHRTPAVSETDQTDLAGGGEEEEYGRQ